jgi:hypothetical protein
MVTWIMNLGLHYDLQWIKYLTGHLKKINESYGMHVNCAKGYV